MSCLTGIGGSPAPSYQCMTVLMPARRLPAWNPSEYLPGCTHQALANSGQQAVPSAH